MYSVSIILFDLSNHFTSKSKSKHPNDKILRILKQISISYREKLATEAD